MSLAVSYDAHDTLGVSLIVAAALLSLISLLLVLVFVIPKSSPFETHSRTNVWGYFASLLVSNVISSFGTVLNLRWIEIKGVTESTVCTFQAILKQIGNVGAAVWSLIIAVHLFNLLFLRSPCTMRGFVITMVTAWLIIPSTVFIGLAANARHSKTYYGPSGLWCWITKNHPTERLLLEYIFEFVSAFLCLVLYILILLRVRGNIVNENRRWRIRFIRSVNTWKLVLGRDVFDTAMLRVAGQMVWYPLVYTIIMLPIAIARFSHFAGNEIPNSITIGTDILFVLHGFLNSILLLVTRHFFPRLFPPPDEVILHHRKTQADEEEKRMFATTHGIVENVHVVHRTSTASSFFSGDRWSVFDHEPAKVQQAAVVPLSLPLRAQHASFATQGLPFSTGYWDATDFEKELPPLPPQKAYLV